MLSAKPLRVLQKQNVQPENRSRFSGFEFKKSTLSSGTLASLHGDEIYDLTNCPEKVIERIKSEIKEKLKRTSAAVQSSPKLSSSPLNIWTTEEVLQWLDSQKLDDFKPKY